MPFIWGIDSRYALRQRVVEAERIDVRIADRDRDRIVVVASNRARPRRGVVGDAVAGADHRLLVEPVDRAQPRREIVPGSSSCRCSDRSRLVRR